MKDLPPDIHSLLASERGAVPPAPDGARERVASRVHATLGLAVPAAMASVSGAAPAAATASAGVGSSVLPVAARWAGVVLAGAVASTVIYLAVRSPQPSAPPSIAPPAAAVVAPSQLAPSAPVAVTAPNVAAAPAVVPAAAPPTVSAPVVLDPIAAHRVRAGQHVRARGAVEPAGDLAAEQALLGEAQAALTAGNARGALDITRQLARRFPHGQFIDMRENIAIRALVNTGDRAAAQVRAQAFRHQFPHSIFLPAVDAVLQ